MAEARTVGYVRAAVLGYARVSTSDQTTDLQVRALQAAGCTRIYQDLGVSGSTPRQKRPQLREALRELQTGDTLVIWKLDRLGRSVLDLVTLLNDLRVRGIRIRSLTEDLDTETIMGRAMLHMCALFAEVERDLIVERTKEGHRAARARGSRFGRPPKLDRASLLIARDRLAEGKSSAKELAAALKVSKSTLYRELGKLRREQDGKVAGNAVER